MRSVEYEKNPKSHRKIKRRKRKILLCRFTILILIAVITAIYYMNNYKNVEGVTKIMGTNILLVNKGHVLSKDYVPANLVNVDIEFLQEATDEERHMTKESAEALKELVQGAAADGIYLCGLSGYRSYETQENIYSYNLKTQGADHTASYVAKAGASEHQLGEAMDLAASWGWIYEGCDEAIWIANNAYKYGFIVRYESGKEETTGYNYEPWHVRYVGKEVAKKIYESNLTLEDYEKRIN